MNIIQDVLALRKQQNETDKRFIAPLNPLERAGVEDWIRRQRRSDRPSKEDWIALWLGGKPFFGEEISALLRRSKAHNIAECCDETDSAALSCWAKSPNPGLHFVLARMDCTRVAVFEAQYAIFIDRDDPQKGARLGPAALDDAGQPLTGFAWFGFDHSDVLHALLYTWTSVCCKAKRARERLCDIADKILLAQP
ncbi:MAG: hypothetical protein WC641_05815 [Patescibacteria group bacterium]